MREKEPFDALARTATAYRKVKLPEVVSEDFIDTPALEERWPDFDDVGHSADSTPDRSLLQVLDVTQASISASALSMGVAVLTGFKSRLLGSLSSQLA